ncbi:MAG TPA: CRISPR-associated DxTHG motif protein [Pyrodictium delaneyi]|uniref:CRISPR-associated DxTHG motif protein n=1 Tax=Pyrodictium delaneyi TaxID=1273541 RepID=A0A832ZV09_9CREN|nr:CRISPR-associated DxTHG motif protein [Pyrodictium delaneyi]
MPTHGLRSLPLAFSLFQFLLV